MKINRHNYEAFLLDQIEGRLSVEDQHKLHEFLLLNPDCREELSEMEPWILEPEKVRFQNSKLLRKEIPSHSTSLEHHNFDLFSIARMEGDLNSNQIMAHQIMVEADDRSAQEWMEWQRVILEPEPLVFEGKNQLRRRSASRSRVIILGMISAAAAVAMLFVLFRTAPDLPQQENAMQIPQEENVMQIPQEETPQEETLQEAHDEPAQAEVQIAMTEPLDNQMDQVAADPPVQKLKDPVLFSIKKDHDRSFELEAEINVVPEDDLQPRVLASAANQLSRSPGATEAVPDQIEPLDVPQVPIHMSSLSIAQISEMDLQEIIEDYREEKDFSLLKVANAGIKGINKLAGSDISLLASRDDEGDVSGYQLKGKRFSFTRPLARED